MIGTRLRLGLAADGEILASLPLVDWVVCAAISIICGVAGLVLLGPSAGAAALVLGTLAVVIAACDARQMLVPDVLSLVMLVSGIAAAVTIVPADWRSALTLSLAGVALGVVLLGGLRWLWSRVRHVEALGLGDVKLAAAVGAWLGPIDLCTAIAVAAVAGLATAGVSLFTGRPRIDRVPFAALLAPACWIVFVLTRL